MTIFYAVYFRYCILINLQRGKQNKSLKRVASFSKPYYAKKTSILENISDLLLL